MTQCASLPTVLILGILFSSTTAVAGTLLCRNPRTSRRCRSAFAAAIPILVALTTPPAWAADGLTGPAIILDDSTLMVAGTRVRLAGVLTPPIGQEVCWDARETPYACGRNATSALRERVGANPIVCEVRSAVERGAIPAVCRLEGEDLGVWMLTQGHAVTVSGAPPAYVAAGDRAWGRRIGLWSGIFSDPAEWR